MFQFLQERLLLLNGGLNVIEAPLQREASLILEFKVVAALFQFLFKLDHNDVSQLLDTLR